MKVDYEKTIATEFGEELEKYEYSEDDEYHQGYSKEYDFEYLTDIEYRKFIKKGWSTDD